MRVLVVGSGAREHALALRFVGEPGVSELVAAPGNPGISTVARCVPVDITKPDEVAALAARERVDFTVVGPEVPLSLGLVDRFIVDGRAIFGPSKIPAQLESSKAFAKAFMERRHIPTARFVTCDTAGGALAVVRSGRFGFPVVLKADGLAAGKGVVIAGTLVEAEATIASVMSDRTLGAAGSRLVVEECLTGPEVSFFVISDGERALPLGSAQDHKRIFDDDRGPNTGGMGAFAPSPLIDPAMHERVMREIVNPVIAGMASEGMPFRGFLFVGLMLTADGPKVIEFNVRLGDPETQVLLPLVDEPLLPVLIAAASGALTQTTLRQSNEKLVGVVMASGGYPESSSSGQEIAGVADADRLPGVYVCHAGTAMRNGTLVTAGGRVLTVIGRGADFEEAMTRAYAGVLQIHFDGMQFRRDIGRKALR
ncbi:MAG TPA: phosphoribosylamine--glycine ligase [Vicinamibacterales bacterium]|jgi:phosphoribosylamine--glycine ligase|nr:phosphoribosylamine--glycine ligase [Vicinamibacterales bacterium]